MIRVKLKFNDRKYNNLVISHATFQPSLAKRSKLDQNPMISESNDTPFSRPNTLSLPQYCSSDLSNALPSLNTPSAGLGGYIGNGDYSSLNNQQTFLTPMTLGPQPVTPTNAGTPLHGELRQL